MTYLCISSAVDIPSQLLNLRCRAFSENLLVERNMQGRISKPVSLPLSRVVLLQGPWKVLQRLLLDDCHRVHLVTAWMGRFLAKKPAPGPNQTWRIRTDIQKVDLEPHYSKISKVMYMVVSAFPSKFQPLVLFNPCRRIRVLYPVI